MRLYDAPTVFEAPLQTLYAPTVYDETLCSNIVYDEDENILYMRLLLLQMPMRRLYDAINVYEDETPTVYDETLMLRLSMGTRMRLLYDAPTVYDVRLYDPLTAFEGPTCCCE